MQTHFSKYFHHLSIFSGVPAYFHCIGINVAKEQNLHPLEYAVGADILFWIQPHKWWSLPWSCSDHPWKLWELNPFDSVWKRLRKIKTNCSASKTMGAITLAGLRRRVTGRYWGEEISFPCMAGPGGGCLPTNRMTLDRRSSSTVLGAVAFQSWLSVLRWTDLKQNRLVHSWSETIPIQM